MIKSNKQVNLITSKENLDKKINFRLTEKIYKKLISYLEKSQKSISSVMRQATYDFLKIKEVFENNGYVDEDNDGEDRRNS